MKFLLLISILFTFSCEKKDTEYFFQNDPPERQANNDDQGTNLYRLKHLGLDANVDVLFVVDNSGSMYTIQSNIIENSKLFMEQFIQERHLDWKLGVISTDKDDKPYLGFDRLFGSKAIDYNIPSSIDGAVTEFQTAIRNLGTNGDASEYIFYNTLRMFNQYSGTSLPFLRGNAHLAVIMVTDEDEQSQSRYGGAYAPTTLLNTLTAYVNSGRKIRFYGALSRIDLDGCDNGDVGDYVKYAGSDYETIINASGGFNISACLDNFGLRLADIGKDIASMVAPPGIPLKGYPKVHTMKVMYKDKILPTGRKEDGGMWYYDAAHNQVIFYSFSFVEDFENDFLQIDFEFDDGYCRPTDPGYPNCDY